jgi:hypothetical protein
LLAFVAALTLRADQTYPNASLNPYHQQLLTHPNLLPKKNTHPNLCFRGRIFLKGPSAFLLWTIKRPTVPSVEKKQLAWLYFRSSLVIYLKKRLKFVATKPATGGMDKSTLAHNQIQIIIIHFLPSPISPIPNG